MGVTVSPFDRLDDTRLVEQITLTNTAGTAVTLLTLGASIQSFLFDGKDIVLGFDRAEPYFHSGAYIGATVGRVCNRTADGVFSLHGQTYHLCCNEESRRVHLHGGRVGFDKKLWSYLIDTTGAENRVVFSTVSPDGEEGYPGTLLISVSYTLTEDNALLITYTATADASTPLNVTNHVYFNLNGCDGDTVHNHLLQIEAPEYTPVTERLVPTGAYAPVAGTAIDFTQPKRIGDALDNPDETMQYTGGVDHNFVLCRTRAGMAPAALAYSPATGIELRCATDLPGLQVYTGNFLDEPDGKYGHRWGKHQGFCLETQFFADSLHHPQFPSIVLAAGEPFSATTVYQVSKREEG